MTDATHASFFSGAIVNPHDPDPLVVLEEASDAFDAAISDLERAVSKFWITVLAILVALAFGLGLFVGVRFAAAASRPAPEHVVRASVQGPIGAPLQRDAGTASDGGADGGGAPSPVTVFEDTSPGITGTASWYPARGYVAAAGPALRTGDWRGRLVVVSANGRSITVTLSDWCACPRRLIDLSDDAFARLAPLSRGLVKVVVIPAGARPTPPATDVQP